ncbi:MAG: exonuclease [Ferruginibacter sp.]|nr:exonuclease [Ferruginibacter sp.]
MLAHSPDLLVIPECEHPSKILFDPTLPQPTDQLWFGHNQHKGLGIFSFRGFRMKLLRNHNPELKLIVPISVRSEKTNFTLFAIWANNPRDPDGQYVEQVWKAIHHYDKKLKRKGTVLAGDFNSNTIWDRKKRAGNHSNVVAYLGGKGIRSCYHVHHGQEQGKEADPTFHLYKHQDKPYHLDYCFASSDLVAKIQSVEIGDYDTWKTSSDHLPLSVTFMDD